MSRECRQRVIAHHSVSLRGFLRRLSDNIHRAFDGYVVYVELLLDFEICVAEALDKTSPRSSISVDSRETQFGAVKRITAHCNQTAHDQSGLWMMAPRLT